jgi:hypothetical protein
MGRRGWLCSVALAAACAATVPTPAGWSGGERRQAANASFRTSLISHCVRVRRPARVAALAFGGSRLPFDLATGQEPGTRPRCRRDELRLLRLQALSIDGRRTYVRRGGCRLPCVKPQATVHVPASALTGRVRLLPRSARNGNGDPVADCRRIVRNAPQLVGPQLRRMYYKTPTELRDRRNAGRSGGDGARWSNYGNPGGTYASAGRAPAPYNYLLWNLPRTPRGLLPGGGIVEAILPAGAPVALCAAERLRLAAFDRRGARNGHVDFGYAKVRGASPAGGSYAIYGWVLLGYRYRDAPYIATTSAPPAVSTRAAPR